MVHYTGVLQLHCHVSGPKPTCRPFEVDRWGGEVRKRFGEGSYSMFSPPLGFWETDFYTPPVLGGAALCRCERQRCIKILCTKDPDFSTPLALQTAKGQHLSALVVYKNQSPNFPLPTLICHVLLADFPMQTQNAAVF